MATYETYRVGDHEFSYVGFPFIVKKVNFDHADLDASNQLDVVIDAGYTVLGTAMYVRTAFDQAADSTIGDGTTADYFMAAAAMTPTSQHDFPVAWKGKPYTAAGIVRVTFTQNPGAGEADLYLFMVNTSTNWRTSGQF